MPTPLTPDEEFDALFRRGLEHHPAQLENPAAWHRMDLLLDANLRHKALSRKVLRVLLVLLLWLCWVVVPGHLLLGTIGKAVATQSAQTAAASHKPASVKLTHSKKLALASSSASSQESNISEVARLASATVAQPAGYFDTQSTTAANVLANAAHNIAASQHAESATQPVAANAAKHHRLAVTPWLTDRSLGQASALHTAMP